MKLTPLHSDPIVIVPFTSDNVKVNRMLRFIQKNWNTILELSDVAMVAKITPQYSSALFSSTMGLTMIQYANAIRINKAGYMLRNTSSSIEKVARDCGFQTTSYFIKLFNESSGVTPGEYRRKNQSIV